LGATGAAVVGGPGCEAEVRIAAGLCERCVHLKIIRSDKGSEFVQCLRSFEDARYAKYPRLPVVVCRGFLAQQTHAEHNHRVMQEASAGADGEESGKGDAQASGQHADGIERRDTGEGAEE